MEDNTNMSGPTTSDEVGGNGENIFAAAAVVEVGNDDSSDSIPPRSYV